MKVTFYGAVREVTGSMHVLNNGDDNIVMDCGLFQGRRKESAEKNRIFPFDPSIATTIVLSHAHIDHSGRIPLMVKSKFNGRVLCTRATADACHFLLLDSGHIQESDAQYLNYKTVRGALSQIKSGKNHKDIGNREKNEIKKLLKSNRHSLNNDAINEMIQKYNLEGVEPLYTVQDAEQALSHIDGVPYKSPQQIGRNLTATFYEAGHILGSAVSMITHEAGGKRTTVCYTGDIGRYDKPILKDPAKNFPEEHRDVDLMIMESTYGDRLHDPVVDLKPKLKEVLESTLERGGTILIPSFAFGRTQELLYVLHELYDNKEVPRVPVHVDSPLATKLTGVFGEHPEVYDENTHDAFLQKGKNPFSFKQVNFTESVEESMALMREKKPHIVISASGMCEAGRILHHLRYKIHNPNNTILIVGYMANHTLGRRILELGSAYEEKGRTGPAPMIRFLNKEYPLKARVVKLGGFSAHGDKNEMLRFLTESGLRVKKIAVVHGEEDQSVAFGKFLNENGYDTIVPNPGESVSLSTDNG